MKNWYKKSKVLINIEDKSLLGLSHMAVWKLLKVLIERCDKGVKQGTNTAGVCF